MEGFFVFAHAGRTGAFRGLRGADAGKSHDGFHDMPHGRRPRGMERGGAPDRRKERGRPSGLGAALCRCGTMTAKAAKARQGAEGAGSAPGGAHRVCAWAWAPTRPVRRPGRRRRAPGHGRDACLPDAGRGRRQADKRLVEADGRLVCRQCVSGGRGVGSWSGSGCGSDARAAAPGSGRKGRGRTAVHACARAEPPLCAGPARQAGRTASGQPFAHRGERGGSGPQTRCRAALSRPSRSCGAKKRAPGRARNQVRWRLA